MLEQETIFAHTLADASSIPILSYFRTPIDIEDKSDASPVTCADKQSEAIMRDLIKKNYPSYGIVGEEYGSENENAEFVWVLDPIDGTKSFITGKPVFGTLIALLQNGEPVLGILNQPYTKERWVGVKDHQTTFNGKPIQTRKNVPLDKSVLYTTGLDMFNNEELPCFERLQNSAKLTRFSSDCYAYGLLALGCVDVVAESNMKLYDFCALVPIVSGAGGSMTDWSGNALGIHSTKGQALALGDPKLLHTITQVLAR